LKKMVENEVINYRYNKFTFNTWTLLKSQQLGTYIFCHKIWKILDIHVDLKQNINIWNSYIK
jgi:hypothetical protein